VKHGDDLRISSRCMTQPNQQFDPSTHCVYTPYPSENTPRCTAQGNTRAAAVHAFDPSIVCVDVDRTGSDIACAALGPPNLPVLSFLIPNSQVKSTSSTSRSISLICCRGPAYLPYLGHCATHIKSISTCLNRNTRSSIIAFYIYQE
jgi:hypothetical protein